MFLSLTFRRAYDAIQTPHHGMRGDLEYLRILHRAASGLQSDVEVALTLLLDEKQSITADAVKELLALGEQAALVPQMPAFEVDLTAYDALLEEVAA